MAICLYFSYCNLYSSLCYLYPESYFFLELRNTTSICKFRGGQEEGKYSRGKGRLRLPADFKVSWTTTTNRSNESPSGKLSTLFHFRDEGPWIWLEEPHKHDDRELMLTKDTIRWEREKKKTRDGLCWWGSSPTRSSRLINEPRRASDGMSEMVLESRPSFVCITPVGVWSDGRPLRC